MIRLTLTLDHNIEAIDVLRQIHTLIAIKTVLNMNVYEIVFK